MRGGGGQSDPSWRLRCPLLRSKVFRIRIPTSSNSSFSRTCFRFKTLQRSQEKEEKEEREEREERVSGDRGASHGGRRHCDGIQ